MANNKKFNVVSIVILAVLAVALIMGIVGICIDWMTCTVEVSNHSSSEGAKLADCVEAELKNIGVVNAFAILTIVMAALTAVCYLVGKFVNVKALKWVTLGLAVALIVCALLALVLTFTTASAESSEVMGMKSTFAPAAGCWLLSVFGILGGAAGVYGAIKG